MRNLIIILISIWISTSAYAQSERLDYYQHTKTVMSNGNVQTQSGNNGQFVRRTKLNGAPRCYDATKSGLEHLNGILNYIGKNNGNEVYKGSSYWGNGTTYQFDDVNGYLNVTDAKGNIYVFKRTTPPSGRTGSSYLVKGASVDGWDAAYELSKIQDSMPVYDNSPTSGSGSSKSKSRKTIKTDTGRSSRTCSHCHGTKRVRANVAVGGFGVSNKKKKCSACGEWYDPTTEHWHACPYCK